MVRSSAKIPASINDLQIAGGDTVIYGINKLINPKKDAKFSPNLYNFLTYKKRYLTNVFQDPETGWYYIGIRDERGVWIGAKLMEVFCRGNNAFTFSYARSITIKWNDVTKWFWEAYAALGKSIYQQPDFNQLKPITQTYGGIINQPD